MAVPVTVKPVRKTRLDSYRQVQGKYVSLGFRIISYVRIQLFKHNYSPNTLNEFKELQKLTIVAYTYIYIYEYTYVYVCI